MAYQTLSFHDALTEPLGLVSDGGGQIAGARVLSAYSRALNLQADDGTVLALVHPDIGNGPGALRVAGDWPLPWQPGAAVALVAGERLQGPGGAVALTGAVAWAPPLPPAPVAAPALAEAIARSLRALAWAGSPAGILPAALSLLAPDAAPPRPTGIAGAAYDMYREGLAALEAGDWPQAVRRLAGLGPGSTPSGDDLLCGFACLLARAGRPEAGDIGSALAALPPTATHPLSRHLLRWAPEGVAGERHLAWVDALLQGGGQAELAPVLAYGAMSGADWAAGALLGAVRVRG